MTSSNSYTFKNQSSVPSRYTDAFANFFRVWDDTTTGDEGVSFFAPNAELIFSPSVSAKGRDGISEFRKNMIHHTKGPVVALNHALDRCWSPTGSTLEDGKAEFLITGYIWYRLTNERKIGGNFASKVIFEDNAEGKPEAVFYEVYLDTHELTTALKELAEQSNSSA